MDGTYRLYRSMVSNFFITSYCRTKMQLYIDNIFFSLHRIFIPNNKWIFVFFPSPKKKELSPSLFIPFTSPRLSNSSSLFSLPRTKQHLRFPYFRFVLCFIYLFDPNQSSYLSLPLFHAYSYSNLAFASCQIRNGKPNNKKKLWGFTSHRRK